VSCGSALRPRWPPQSNLALHRILLEIHITIFSSETTGPITTKLWYCGSNSRSTALEVTTLTITPPMQSNFICNISLNLYYISYSNFIIIYFNKEIFIENTFVNRKLEKEGVVRPTSACELRVIFIIIIHHIFSNQVMFDTSVCDLNDIN
jgi:hypothetical protein